jgi:hypothetical protein
VGHSSYKCFAREKRKDRVNPVVTNVPEISSVTCLRCGEKGHFATQCRKPPKKRESSGRGRSSRNNVRRSESMPSDRLLYSIGCRSLAYCDYVELDLDVGNGYKLQHLVDIGDDISLLKSKTLLGTTEYEHRDRVRVKSVEGSVIEIHGSIETKILEGTLQILFRFQLVIKQFDLLEDGIFGLYFLK